MVKLKLFSLQIWTNSSSAVDFVTS